ncbi:condensation domain-containing protein [Nocardioides sambongensis]|uniref:condensation domain-containing protein n=1 Tax=Nocardioides sambongensis TaxID=2589074 RepID=UPI00112DD99F|nr:condensation domain-containing protein [Nocardioides sambongensis]
MRLTPAEEWGLPPGRLHTVRPVGSGPPPFPTPLSVNQRNHVAGVGHGQPSVWLAFSCQVPGGVDAARLERVAAHLVRRHSALQMSAVVGASGPTGRRHHPADIRFRRSVAPVASGAEATVGVRAHLDAACHPVVGAPAFGLAAIEQAHGRSTVVAGFDHLHVDALSLPVLLQDVVAALGVGPPHRRAQVAPAGCFASRAREWASAAPIPSDDPRLRRWHHLLDLTGDRLPGFPFDLGLAPGERAPQSTTTHDLADAATTRRLGDAARRHGASTAAACLATFGTMLRAWGGPATLPLLVPVQTRTPADGDAVGWFTTTVPVVLGPSENGVSPRSAAAALAAGVQTAELPLDQVLASLPRPLRRERADVFMLSYVDYRRLPGHDLSRRLGARHVSSPTTCDDVQIWVARTDDGLHARVRSPGTPTATRLLPALVQSWTEEIAALAAT